MTLNDIYLTVMVAIFLLVIICFSLPYLIVRLAAHQYRRHARVHLIRRH